MHTTPSDPVRRSWGPMIAVALGQAQMSWNVSALPVSVGGIVEEFDVAPTVVSTAIVLYSLAVAATIMAGARLGRRLGAANAFRMATAVFLIAMIAMTLARSAAAILLAQALAGLAAAVIVPMLVVLIIAHYEGTQREKALGLLSGVQALGIAVGFLLSGAASTWLGWRWAFGFSWLIAGAALLFSMKLDRTPGDPAIRVDWTGFILAAMAASGIAIGVNGIADWGLLRASEEAPFQIAGFSPALPSVAVGVGLLAVFFRRNAKRECAGQPTLVSMDVFAKRGQKPALICLHATELIGSALLFLVPLYIQVVQGRTGLQTSVAMAPYQVAVSAAAVLVVGLYARLSPRALAGSGLFFMALGLLTLAWVMRQSWSNGAIVLGLLIAGAGQGVLMSVLTNTLIAGTPPRHAADAGAMRGAVINLSAGLGAALAATLSVGFLAAAIPAKLENHPLNGSEFVQRLDLTKVAFISNDRLQSVAERYGATAEEAMQAAEINEAARLRALKLSYLSLALIAVLSLVVTLFLPGRRSPAHERPGI